MENITSSEEKNLNEFEINELVKETYTKIAEWHNDEPNKTSLKFLSIELVEDIAGKVFEHFGLTYTSSLKMDESIKAKLSVYKKSENKTTKSVDEMSDLELLKEIENRKMKNNKL